MKHCIATIILILCIVSCNNRSHHWETLMQVETFIEERPDSALAVLEQINKAELSSKEEKAKHALLLSIALDKNYIDLTTDSIINIAVQYYKNTKQFENYFSSLYYLARVQYNAGNSVTAIYTLTQAEDFIPYVNNKYKQALLYSFKGAIYDEIYDSEKAIPCHSKAIDLYTQTNKIRICNNAKLSLADSYFREQEMDSAEHYILQVLDWATVNNDKKLLQESHNALITIYDLNKQELKLEELLKSKYFINCDTTFVMSLSLAQKFAKKNDYEKSLSFLFKAKEMVKNIEEEVLLHRKSSSVYSILGMYDKAFTEAEKSLALHDSLIDTAIKKPIVAIQRDFYHSQAINHKKNLEISKWQTLAAICLLLLISFVLIFYYKFSRKEIALKNAEIDNLFDLSQTLKGEVILQKSSIDDMKNKIQTLFAKQFFLLNKLCITYYETTPSKKERDAIYKEVKLEIEKLGSDNTRLVQLENIVNEYMNDIITKLKSDFPQLKDKDIHIYILLLAGFSAKAVSVMTGTSTDVVYAKKSRLKKQILLSNSNYKEEYLTFFT